MTPRLMVVCLGGLAGGGAMVCCDLNEGLEDADETADGNMAEVTDAAAEMGAVEADAVH